MNGFLHLFFLLYFAVLKPLHALEQHDIYAQSDEFMRNSLLYPDDYTRLIEVFGLDANSLSLTMPASGQLQEVVVRFQPRNPDNFQSKYNGLHIVVECNDTKCREPKYGGLRAAVFGFEDDAKLKLQRNMMLYLDREQPLPQSPPGTPRFEKYVADRGIYQWFERLTSYCKERAGESCVLWEVVLRFHCLSNISAEYKISAHLSI